LHVFRENNLFEAKNDISLSPEIKSNFDCCNLQSKI
jgi:hypothetical protein